MPDLDMVSVAEPAMASRVITFRMDGRLYALPAEEVSEVVRMPPVARLPHSPKGLLGIANIRGAAMPIASLRGLLGREEAGASMSLRAIVLRGAAPVALAVDAVQTVVTLEAGRIEPRQAELAAEPGERLRGAFQSGKQGELAKILDIQAMLAAAIMVPQARRQPQTSAGSNAMEASAEPSDQPLMLVTFSVAGQEYALALDVVQEILPAPETLATLPRTEAMILGVTTSRDTLLPLLSLRGLLGFAPAAANGREKVIVTTVGAARVGLVADRMQAVVSANRRLVERLPSVIAARSGGEARIQAIYRGEAGRRLIAILAPDQLFREEVMQRLDTARDPVRDEADQAEEEEFQFLVFRLGPDEFALPIAAVDEVAHVPQQITRVPRTPAFLEGVINLRGEVLPVVDQRRRFGMPVLADERRRLVVVRTQRHRAGLIVDGVSEVLRVPARAIAPAPDLAGETTQLVQGVINLEEAGRLVLLLDPAELLSRAEQGLLDAFAADAGLPDL
jgi:purine-binding chemotaxis protein CheW